MFAQRVKISVQAHTLLLLWNYHPLATVQSRAMFPLNPEFVYFINKGPWCRNSERRRNLLGERAVSCMEIVRNFAEVDGSNRASI